MASAVPRPLVLCVVEGMGERDAESGNAVRLAKTPHLAALRAAGPATTLVASGSAVGLPEGQAGSGAAGHLALGAGRAVASERARIDQALAERHIGRNAMIDQTMRIALYEGCTLHLIGLVSDGGVHASLDHLRALIDVADFHGIAVVVHAILDGRDVGRRSALGYLERVELFMEGKNARIGTLSGRRYAMDRDGRWDRTYEAFQAIVRDKVLGPRALSAETAFDGLSQAYAQGHSDDEVVPVRLGDYQGIKGEFMCDFASTASDRPVWEWTGEECGIACNFRGDRLRQLAAMLTRQGLPPEIAADLLMDRDKPVLAFRANCLATLTDYGLDLPIAFARERLEGTFGQALADAGLTQARVVESEKVANATHWFDGRGELPAGASLEVAATPRLIERFEHKPALSAEKVAAKTVAAIESGSFDFVLSVLGHTDVVAHGGKLEAAIGAIEAADAALGRIAAAVRAAGGALVVTSSHGQCEQMLDDKGAPQPAHTTHPVPLIYAGNERVELRGGGSLCDVAPTLLGLLGVARPAAMTGRSLLADNP